MRAANTIGNCADAGPRPAGQERSTDPYSLLQHRRPREAELSEHGDERSETIKAIGVDVEVLVIEKATAHPEIFTAVVQSAASDWAATRLTVAIERVAIALAEPEETQQRIVSASEFLRPRP